jgi:hypothetical protein
MWQASEGLIAILAAVFALGALRILREQLRSRVRREEPESVAVQGNVGTANNDAAIRQAVYGSQHKAAPQDKTPKVEDLAAKGI